MPTGYIEERAGGKRARLLIGLSVLVCLIVVLRFLPFTTWLGLFNNWVKGLGTIGYVIFIIGYVAATVLFLPGSVLTLGAGFIFGVIGGSIVASIGSVAGASLSFMIARYLARDRVSHRLSQSEKFGVIDAVIGEQGGKIVLLLRLSPIFPFNALNYLLGLTAVKFWHYLVASWIGIMPGTVLYVYLGFIGKAGMETASWGVEKSSLEYISLIGGLILTAVGTVYVTRIARRALRENLPQNGVDSK